MTADATIVELVASAGAYLPDQAPLHSFVHHNTLHVFEHLEFHEAVVEAARLFGTRPYMAEARFADALSSGRITAADVSWALGVDGSYSATASVIAGWTWERVAELRLTNLFEVPSEDSVEWALHEGGQLERLHPSVSADARAELERAGTLGPVLEQLWQTLLEASQQPDGATPVGLRPREQLVAAGAEDPDRLVHPLLIRLAAAYLDQGVGYWSMPHREDGFLSAFRQLYSNPVAPPDRWLRSLPSTLSELHGASAEQVIGWTLERLRVSREKRGEVLRATLLSLKGWAGMFRHLERRPDRAPVVDPKATLIDFAAVQLILDTLAAEHCATSRGLNLSDLGRSPSPEPKPSRSLAYEAFVLAQLAGLGPAELDGQVAAWMSAVRRLDEWERGRLLQLAYERRHEVSVLDGLEAHAAAAVEGGDVSYQAVFCIDEREESLRRHLEEIDPVAETVGYAGFFGVAMAYQDIEALRPVPLCPVAVRPRHLVREEALDANAHASYAKRKRAGAKASHGYGVATQTLARGGLVAAATGLAAVVPLVGRCLFPRVTEGFRPPLSHPPRPSTRLVIERDDDADEVDGYLPGYTISEMADVVQGLLQTTGLARRLSKLVLIVGHGSSSLNNPHEAAHDCGATGGGRGGPNARAFCLMANHPKVRALLLERGQTIGEETWFLAGYHNTCDDSLEYYDAELLPANLQEVASRAQRALAQAAERDAHERCRRFEDAPPRPSPRRALQHARAHAMDLGQPRPEYGHATNAVCVVGRRWRTRGLFLDRRAFLVSYDPTTDASGDILTKLLLSVCPVGAGINLEYYFSYVDPTGYGCGTKLPHNVTGLLGVMDGHASDLRTGLPWQMVEIHEPVRLLTIVEASPETLSDILAKQEGLRGLIDNGWIRVVAWDPDSPRLWSYRAGRFWPHESELGDIPRVKYSADYYEGRTDNLHCATTMASLVEVQP